MIEILGTVCTTLAVAGVVLNNRLRIECFYLWLISNCIAASIHISAGLIAMSIKDLIFIVLAVEGIYKWRDRKTG